MAEFRVVIDGLAEDDELVPIINERIQSAVLESIAGGFKGINLGRFKARQPAIIGRFDPEWLGIWLRQINVDQFDQIVHDERFGPMQ